MTDDSIRDQDIISIHGFCVLHSNWHYSKDAG